MPRTVTFFKSFPLFPQLMGLYREFKQVDGKEEMIIHIQDQRIIYINDGTQFKPQG